MSELKIDLASIGGVTNRASETSPAPELASIGYIEPDAIPLSGRFYKRALDLLIAVPSLILAVPVLVALAIVIRMESRGGAIYRSRRMGRSNLPFTCYKLRTMVDDADALQDHIRHLSYRNGATFKIVDDPRTTSIGKWLRKYSVDEFPQLWNVVKGEMSIVGPRPHSLDDVSRYSNADLRRHRVKPGLTGLWQITARKDPSFRRNMELDNLYIDSWSMWSDLRIIAQTFTTILRGDGE
jgi:lipopolysaccharide/colanic/teichoic acid biosynthesis glycosyltransferase